MVHQNHENEKNSSEFFEYEIIEEPRLFSTLRFPGGIAVSPKSVRNIVRFSPEQLFLLRWGHSSDIISQNMPENKLEFVKPVMNILSSGLCRRV
jgi:hypothetical protein